MAVPPPHRLLRASVFAAVCVTLSMAGHAVAARDAVPWAAVGAGGLGVLGVAWVLAGHERSALTILGGLLGGQFGLHVLFAAAQAGPVTHAEHVAHQDAVVPGGPGMTLAHVAAAAVSAWWLWRGERLAWTLARRFAALSRVCAVVLLEVPPAPVRRRVPLTAAVPRPVPAPLRHSVGLRGPPLRSVFTS
ncbi:MAG TPA: hypothetical protein VHJ17_26580 [Thermomonospora sp.]|nr:hypothetical protein [Thermomonospora sp.]